MPYTSSQTISAADADCLIQILRANPEISEREFHEFGLTTDDLQDLMVKLQYIAHGCGDHS